MSSTRTGPQAAKLVEAVQADLGEIVESLSAGLAKMRSLETDAKGVNGLASTLKGQGNSVEQVVQTLQEASDKVSQKLVGSTPPEPIAEHVNQELANDVAKAKAAS